MKDKNMSRYNNLRNSSTYTFFSLVLVGLTKCTSLIYFRLEFSFLNALTFIIYIFVNVICETNKEGVLILQLVRYIEEERHKIYDKSIFYSTSFQRLHALHSHV